MGNLLDPPLTAGSIGRALGFAPPDASRVALNAPASDLVPSRHLSNLAGKTSAVVAIIGDSTMMGDALAGNFVDPTSAPWNYLQEKLKADNPQITSWTFLNFAIGGSNENQPLQTGVASGLGLPTWFTDSSQTWLSYVQAAAPDVLFYGFGTNAATSGMSAGSSAATFIRLNMENIAGWTKLPNIVIVTTKDANPSNDTSGDDASASAHQSQAAFHRTFARTNAAGYTSFAALQKNAFGLVDLGENYSRNVRGFSARTQYLQSVPSALTTSKALAAWAQAFGSTTIGRTANGDFRLVFRILAGGGAALFNYGGGNAIKISLSEFIGNYLRLNIGSTGNVSARYILDGNTGGAPMQSGAAVGTSSGQDVRIVVSLAGSRLLVTVNGTVSLDARVPRFYGPVPGGTPINIGFTSAPTGTPTIAVDEFFEGIGVPFNSAIAPTAAFGAVASGSSSLANFRGGNNQNHADTRTLAYDKLWIDAMNFAVSSGFLQGGTGAAPTSVDAELRSKIRPQQFYVAGEASQAGMVQRALNYAGTLTDNFGPYVIVDLGGLEYTCNATIDMRDKPHVVLMNGKLKAVAGGSLDVTVPLVWMGKNLNTQVVKGSGIERVRIDCAHLCAGILNENTISNYLRQVGVFHQETYGIRLQTKTGAMILDGVTCRQYEYGDAGWDSVANRTAYGFDILAADVVVNDCNASYAFCPFHVGTQGCILVTNSHFYNGGTLDGGDEMCAWVDGAPDCSFSNCYFDNGIVRISDVFTTTINDCFFQENSDGTNSAYVDLIASAANEKATGLQIMDNRVASTATFVRFSTSGAGSWATNLKCRIWGNIRNSDGSLAPSFGYTDSGLTTHGSGSGTQVKVYDGGAGFSRGIGFRTNGLPRWAFLASSTAESGGAAGSDLIINRSDDAGNFVDTPWQISRSTGDNTVKRSISGAGSIALPSFALPDGSGLYSKGTNNPAVALNGKCAFDFADGAATLGNGLGSWFQTVDGAAGSNRGFRIKSGGLDRWYIATATTAETGSNAGSNFNISAYDDSGAFLATALTITRSTQAVSVKSLLATSTGGLGYGTGAGGTVTQATSKSTGVTLNKTSGQITMNAAALAASAKVTFTVTNSTVAATDTPVPSVASGGTANAYRVTTTAVAAGSFALTVENITAGSLSEAPVINFNIIKGSAS